MFARRFLVIMMATIVTLVLVPLAGGEHNGISADNIVINEIFDSVDNRDEWWLELYNPTNHVIDTTGWAFWSASIYCPIPLPIDNMLPGEYVVLCSSRETFMNLWTLPEGTRCIEIRILGNQGDWIRLDNGTNRGVEPGVETIDEVPQRGGLTEFPTLEPGHSWSRYTGGYDTDNFANDFYDEPFPTPGRPNSRVKVGGYPPALTAGTVTPTSGTVGTTFTYEVTYTDADDNAPVYLRVYIDNAMHDMTKISGDYITGATYQYSWVTTSADVGSHDYYFEASDGVYTVRLPTSGSYSGPMVIGAGTENLTYVIIGVITVIIVCGIVYMTKIKR